jgi:hemolysin activation/secretion protein
MGLQLPGTSAFDSMMHAARWRDESGTRETMDETTAQTRQRLASTGSAPFRALGWLSLCLLVAAGASAARAQDVPSGPARPFDPSRELRELSEPQPQSAPRSEVLIPDRAESAAASTDQIEVVPQAFDLIGVTAIDREQLLELAAPYRNRTMTLADLQALAQAMTRRYREAGYVLSEVFVPEQRIDVGTAIVRLQAVEGYVTSVELSGDRTPHVLQGYLQQITRSRPLHIADLERYLLLANDVPGYQLRTVLTPAEGVSGAAKLVVEASRKSFDSSFGIDNSGTDTIGRYRADVSLSINGLTGRGERTDIGYETANDFDELQQVSFGHSELVGPEGTQVQLSGSWSQVQPGADLTPYEIDGTIWQADLSVYQPLIRERSRNLSARLGVGTISSVSSVLSERQFDDRYPYAFLNLSYDVADAYRGVTIASLDLRKGFDAFDAGINGRVGARPDFSLAKLYVGRNQDIGSGLSLYGAVFGQYAFEDLPASEEISFGGNVLGRGYDRSEIAADHGVGAKLELRYQPAWALLLRPSQLYVFYDWADVREATEGQVLDNGRRSQSLASTGVGAKFNLQERISFQVEFAQPLTRGVASDDSEKDVRINFMVRAVF